MSLPFSEEIKNIGDEMGISMYQLFTLNEASLFLRCPVSELEELVRKKRIQYIQISKTEVKLFGYQLLDYLLKSIVYSHATIPKSQNNNSQDRIIRAKEVQDITGLSRTTIWRMESKGQFPQRIPLSAGSVGWKLSDVELWIKSR